MTLRKRLSDEIIPNMYSSVKEKVKSKPQPALQAICGHGLLQNLNVTTYCTDKERNLISYSLQTEEVETHKSSNFANMLTAVIQDWGLIKKDPGIWGRYTIDSSLFSTLDLFRSSAF